MTITKLKMSTPSLASLGSQPVEIDWQPQVPSLSPLPRKKQSIIDVMVDLETMGLCDNVVITQLSAVAFVMRTGEILEAFDEHISVRNSVERGLKIDGSTVEWWFKQSIPVFNDVLLKAIQLNTEEGKLESVLGKFTVWLNGLKKNYGIDFRPSLNIWGNGALADNKWLRQAYKVAGMEPAWHFTEDRDVRTLTDLGKRIFNFDYKQVKFEGTPHNALDDSKHQIKYSSEIYKQFEILQVKSD